MLFLRSLIDFPSNFHRICIEFASALQRRIIGGSLEEQWGWNYSRPDNGTAEILQKIYHIY